MSKLFTKSILLLLCLVSEVQFSDAQTLSFPNAEGFGRYTSGGRGGIVYKVTNLNNEGEGSLRKGVLKHDVRIIVFEVAGTIELQSPLDVNHGNITIAGQTAPGQGITLKGYPVSVKADNVIIRYMRFRMGDINKIEGDALGGRNHKNIIIDHCSISWATDENASFYWNTNFTMQYCIISEALNKSVHHKGAHGYGGIWGGVNASFHHNLIASNTSRNPRFGGSESVPNSPKEFVDFRNNVIFNWKANSIYGGENGTYNVINNYFKPGPATEKSKKTRILNPSKPYGRFYVNGNFMKGAPEVSEDNWNGGVQCENPKSAKLDQEISIENNVKTTTAENAYHEVLKNVGANLVRDEVDKRIIQEVESGKTKCENGIIDSQEAVGGWPELRKGKKILDTDADGMPDDWENKNNLDFEEPNASAFDLDINYTNIEIYLNELTRSNNSK